MTGFAAVITPSSEEDLTRLWYARLGHMSEKGMTILSKGGLLATKVRLSLFSVIIVCSENKKRLAFLLPHTVLNMPMIIFILICGVLLEFFLLGENVIC